MPGYLEKLKKMPAIVREASSPAETPLRGNAVYAVSTGWDQTGADAELAAVEGVIDQALSRRSRTDAQRRVLLIYRGLARRHHRARDSLLWDVSAAVERLLTEWRM